MTAWMQMVLRGSLKLLQGILRDATGRVTAVDVPGAKQQVKDDIQGHRRLPGTLRRWLCTEVDAVQADTVAAFQARLYDAIGRLSL